MYKLLTLLLSLLIVQCVYAQDFKSFNGVVINKKAISHFKRISNKQIGIAFIGQDTWCKLNYDTTAQREQAFNTLYKWILEK